MGKVIARVGPVLEDEAFSVLGIDHSFKRNKVNLLTKLYRVATVRWIDKNLCNAICEP